MLLEGTARRFGRDINTDYIMGSRHRSKTLDWNELAKHIMEDIRPGFFGEIRQGDFIVADENFGCGSSREYAPKVIRAAGISAVLAKSFARIFFRNAVNLGLPLVVCDTSGIAEGDTLRVSLEKGTVENVTRGITVKATPIPEFMLAILREGGLAPYIKAYGPGVFSG
ncbi:MAG: 3-isopropylmalate dehydratase [Ignavibacteriales bacterium]